MRAQISIQGPFPPQIDQSYEPFGFYKFGLCCWQYEGFDGQIEWINTQFFCTEPKYPGPTAFRYWFQKNVFALVQVVPTIRSDMQSFKINGVNVNPATGDGMPLLLTG